MPSCRGDVIVFCAGADTRGSLMAVGAVLLLIATVISELRSRGTIIQAIHPRFSWHLALVAVSVGASQIAESLNLLAVEDTLELYGYLVLMLSAGWMAFWSAARSRLRSGLPRSD